MKKYLKVFCVFFFSTLLLTAAYLYLVSFDVHQTLTNRYAKDNTLSFVHQPNIRVDRFNSGKNFDERPNFAMKFSTREEKIYLQLYYVDYTKGNTTPLTKVIEVSSKRDSQDLRYRVVIAAQRWNALALKANDIVVIVASVNQLQSLPDARLIRNESELSGFFKQSTGGASVVDYSWAMVKLD